MKDSGNATLLPRGFFWTRQKNSSRNSWVNVKFTSWSKDTKWSVGHPWVHANPEFLSSVMVTFFKWHSCKYWIIICPRQSPWGTGEENESGAELKLTRTGDSTKDKSWAGLRQASLAARCSDDSVIDGLSSEEMSGNVRTDQYWEINHPAIMLWSLH